ncbi:hypothetical protein D9M72_455150 [compost metagenome]
MRHAGIEGAELHQICGSQGLLAELPNGDRQAVDGQRLDDDVDASPVGQARIDHRVRFVEPASQRCQDAPHDPHHVLGIGEAQRFALQHAVARHIDVLVAVDQDVFDGRVVQQVFQRAEAGQLLRQRIGDELHLAVVDRHAAQAHEAVDLQFDELLDRRARPAAELRAQFFDATEQVIVRPALDVLELLGVDERLVVVGEFDIGGHGLFNLG